MIAWTRNRLFMLAATLLLILAGALVYRAIRQVMNASEAAIRTPNGVEESLFVSLGGVEQWVEIRGEDRRNPVILFVHGGPGASVTPLSSRFRSWEKDFTVVMWDQRCAGKTFVRNGPRSCRGMSIENVARDGVALTGFLERRLGKDKVILLGHSWGTMVGLRMVKDRPDLYSAYVGTGQVVSIPEKEEQLYRATLAKLHQANDADGVKALTEVGPPPYKSFQGLKVERMLSERLDIPAERDLRKTMTPVALFAPGWSLWDLYQTFERAQDPAEQATFDADAHYDARRLGPEFKAPVYMINGEFDTITPTALALQYFGTIRAPAKAFTVLKNAGHSAVLTDPEGFLAALKAQLSPPPAPALSPDRRAG